MKIKHSVTAQRSTHTEIFPIGVKLVEITHSQSATQSLDYNSRVATYGVKFAVDLQLGRLEHGIEAAEKFVEAHLHRKMEEHAKQLTGS